MFTRGALQADSRLRHDHHLLSTVPAHTSESVPKLTLVQNEQRGGTLVSGSILAIGQRGTLGAVVSGNAVIGYQYPAETDYSVRLTGRTM